MYEFSRWRLRPIFDPFDSDRTLVVGEEKKTIQVNKEVTHIVCWPFSTCSYSVHGAKFQTLASQSPFFDRLFNGDFKEKNMSGIFIGDVEYEVS